MGAETGSICLTRDHLLETITYLSQHFHSIPSPISPLAPSFPVIGRSPPSPLSHPSFLSLSPPPPSGPTTSSNESNCCCTAMPGFSLSLNITHYLSRSGWQTRESDANWEIIRTCPVSLSISLSVSLLISALGSLTSGADLSANFPRFFVAYL